MTSYEAYLLWIQLLRFFLPLMIALVGGGSVYYLVWLTLGGVEE